MYFLIAVAAIIAAVIVRKWSWPVSTVLMVGGVTLLAFSIWPTAPKGKLPTDQATVPDKPVFVEPTVKVLDNQDKWTKVRYPLKGTLPSGDRQWSFAGILPMKKKGEGRRELLVDVRVAGVDSTSSFFLVDGWASNQQPLSCQALVDTRREVHKYGLPDASRNVFPLYGVPFTKALWNDNSEFISSVYLQNSAGKGGTTLTRFDAGPTVQQWWVDLDSADSTNFTLVGEWEYCWIVPIYDSAYFGNLAGFPVSPRGWSDQELVQNLGLDPKEPIPPAGDVPRMAPYCRTSQGTKLLTEVIIFDKAKDKIEGPLTLGVKFVWTGRSKFDKPIRVLVGMSSPTP